MTPDAAPAYGLWLLAFVNAAVFIIFALSFFKPQTARDWRSFGAFSAFLVALFLVQIYQTQDGPVVAVLQHPVLAKIGLVSYGVFLWHLMLLRVLMPALGIPYFSGRFLEVTALLVVVTLNHVTAPLARRVAVGAVVMSISIMLYVILLHDRPFIGYAAQTTDPILKATGAAP